MKCIVLTLAVLAIAFIASTTVMPMQAIAQFSCNTAYPSVFISMLLPDIDSKDISYKNFKVLPLDLNNLDQDRDSIGFENKEIVTAVW